MKSKYCIAIGYEVEVTINGPTLQTFPPFHLLIFHLVNTSLKLRRSFQQDATRNKLPIINFQSRHPGGKPGGSGWELVYWELGS